MNESIHTTSASADAGLRAWWSTAAGTWTALALVVLVGAGVIFGQMSSLGIWEPWEADEIRVGREFAQRGAASADTQARADEATAQDDPSAKAPETSAPTEPNWATPTFNQKPVARPLLKTWILAKTVGEPAESGEYHIGELERAARMPFALVVFAFALVVFFWVRRHFDTWSALLVGLILVTSPAVFLGAHTLSADTLFLVLSSLAIIAFFELTRADTARARWAWGLSLGAALALSFLEHRFFGLLNPLAVIVGFALAELPFEQLQRARENPAGVAPRIARLDLGLALSALLGAVAVVVWGIWRSAEADTYFLPHVLQWIALLGPSLLLLAGALLVRQTRAGRALFSLPALAGALLCALVVGVVVQAYGQANPILLANGEIHGKIPLFSFLLENHLSGSSPAADHMHFAMWAREIGFSLFPWIALVPLGVGYLSLATRAHDDAGQPIEADLLNAAQASARRLLLVWSFIALGVVSLAAAFHHFYFPAYLPLVAGVGLMLGDTEFFRSAQMRSFLRYAMGFVAVAIIMMLGKDLERFPDRFMEPYLAMQEKLGLPEDFSFGKTLKAIKYGWAILLGVYFFALVSAAGLTVRNLRLVPGRVKAWRAARKAQSPGAQPALEVAAESAGEESPLLRRMLAAEDYRREKGILARVAAFAESPQTWGLIILAAGVLTAGVFLYRFAPEQGLHLSQRGIFEAYTHSTKPGEALFRYNLPGNASSVYLGEVPDISRVDAFEKNFDQPERYYVVMPRDQLAAVNFDVRRRFGRDLPVLDASSNKLLLASNQLAQGEVQQNFVARAIVDDPENFQPPIPLWFADQGKMVPPTFDDSLELIGWDIDRKPADGSFPSYATGEKAKLTFFFRVKQRVGRAQKIFMHVDYGGSRLHGDHEPVNGDFPTNYWLPGDIIRDEYTLHIESYSSPGIYTIWLGFFRGNDRMKVSPRQAQTGDNRVRVGQIAIGGML